MTVVLVTGAAGFVGRAALRGLADARIPARAVVHRTSVSADATDVVTADLTDPGSLDGAWDGVTAVIHAASQVGADAVLCDAVNYRGTAHLVAAAQRAGIARIVAVSTTGVYGDATADCATVDDLVTAPVSATSRSRLRGETHVLGTGGVVLRPHFVHGIGDRWVIPGIATLVTTVGGLPAGGGAPLSLIAVTDLARLLVALATGPGWIPGQIYHAADPVPVTLTQIVTQLRARLGLDLPQRTVPFDEAVRRAGHHARRVGQLALPHWYEATHVWRATGLPYPPAFATRLGGAAHWYRQHLDH